MAVSKRTALGTGFGVIIGLLVLSTGLAYRIQESFSARSVAIHREYVRQQETLTSLRRVLYTAGTSARDYVLNPSARKTEAYNAYLLDLRRSSEALLSRLERSSSNKQALSKLEGHMKDLWNVLHAVAAQGPDAARSYSYIQREIAPKRNAAGQILQDLETANYSALTESEAEFSSSRSAAARNLLWLLGSCLLGGAAIAWSSLRYSENLERQSAARFDEVLKAKMELERLSNRLMEIQEEERTRLSRELHDEIVQNLAVLKIEITQALASLDRGSARESLTRARDLADRTVRTVRDITLLLRPSLLDDLGLGPALQWQTDDFSRRTGVPCDYSEENLEEGLPDAVKTCVYRVTQEALRNSEKHSSARKVTVRVAQTHSGLSVEVRDDGVGFQSERRSPASLGVLGMRERAATLGGDLNIESVAGKGTAVRLWLPLAGSDPRITSLEAHA